MFVASPTPCYQQHSLYTCMMYNASMNFEDLKKYRDNTFACMNHRVHQEDRIQYEALLQALLTPHGVLDVTSDRICLIKLAIANWEVCI